MKVIVNENKELKPVKYPCLLRGLITRSIVLFTGLQEGVLIEPGVASNHEAGRTFTDQDMSLYEVFDGAITLKND